MIKPITQADFNRIKKMSLNEFNKWVISIYESGCSDGKENVTTEISEEALREIILSVKGIGARRAAQVMDAVLSYGEGKKE